MINFSNRSGYLLACAVSAGSLLLCAIGSICQSFSSPVADSVGFLFGVPYWSLMLIPMVLLRALSIVLTSGRLPFANDPIEFLIPGTWSSAGDVWVQIYTNLAVLGIAIALYGTILEIVRRRHKLDILSKRGLVIAAVVGWLVTSLQLVLGFTAYFGGPVLQGTLRLVVYGTTYVQSKIMLLLGMFPVDLDPYNRHYDWSLMIRSSAVLCMITFLLVVAAYSIAQRILPQFGKHSGGGKTAEGLAAR